MVKFAPHANIDKVDKKIITLVSPVGLVPFRIQGVVDDGRLGEFGATEDDVDEGIRHVFVVHLKKVRKFR